MKIQFEFETRNGRQPPIVGSVDIDMHELGHEICMGIRMGLFGVDASNNEHIGEWLLDAARVIADAMPPTQDQAKEIAGDD